MGIPAEEFPAVNFMMMFHVLFGGGLYASGATTTLANSILWGNGDDLFGCRPFASAAPHHQRRQAMPGAQILGHAAESIQFPEF